MGGLAEGRLRRCPVSGGVDSERERLVASTGSALGVLGRTSWVKAGWLGDWVGVGGDAEIPEAEGGLIEKLNKGQETKEIMCPLCFIDRYQMLCAAASASRTLCKCGVISDTPQHTQCSCCCGRPPHICLTHVRLQTSGGKATLSVSAKNSYNNSHRCLFLEMFSGGRRGSINTFFAQF